jgi:hypothetical protein
MQLAEERPVAYYPKLVKVTGSVNAAIFLSQLGYWTPKAADPDGWVYKTQAEWETETGLSRWEQETARRQLRERGVLSEIKRGMPARLFFQIDVEALTATWEEAFAADASEQDEEKPHPRMRDPHKQDADKPGSGSPSLRENLNQQPAVTAPKDVASPQTSNKEAGTTAGTTSNNTGGGVIDINFEDLKTKLQGEFLKLNLDDDLLEPTLEELRLTISTGSVRYPLRYCLKTAQNLQAARNKNLGSAASDQLHLEWRRAEDSTCPHGESFDSCQSCKDDVARGARFRRSRKGVA